LTTKSNFFFKLENISGTLSSTITLLTSVYFAARQQCKGNPLLRFHGNTQRLYIADSYLYFNNNTKGKHFCVSLATMIVTFNILCLSYCAQYLWQNSCFYY